MILLSTLLARLSDSNEETTDTDDSFDYLEAGMAEGELYEVSSSCSDVVDSSASDDNGDFGEGSDFAYDPSLLGPSSGLVGAGNFSSDSSSGTENNGDSLSSPYWMLGHMILSINSAKTCTWTKACIGVINCQVVKNE